jgi:hypothetical protein
MPGAARAQRAVPLDCLGKSFANDARHPHPSNLDLLLEHLAFLDVEQWNDREDLREE